MWKIGQIYEGWRNRILPPKQLKEEIEKIRGFRMDICKECPYNSKFHKTLRPDEHCMLCGCTLSAKTSCLSCECPDIPPRWTAVVTQEQEDEMEKHEIT